MFSRTSLSLVAAMVAVPTFASAALQPGYTVLADGHMDFRASAVVNSGPQSVDWDLFLQHDSLGIFDTDEALMHLLAPGELTPGGDASPGGRVTVPNDVGSMFDFTGVAPGGTIYRFPQLQLPNLLWPGASTENIADGTFSADFENTGSDAALIDFHFLAKRGPGEVSIWTEGDGLADMKVASLDGFDAADRLTLLEGDHVHFELGFSQPGYYEVDFRASALLDDGSGTLVSYFSGIETLHYGIETTVAPEPAALTLLAIAGVLALRRRRV